MFVRPFVGRKVPQGWDYLLDLGNIGESEALERRKSLKEHGSH